MRYGSRRRKLPGRVRPSHSNNFGQPSESVDTGTINYTAFGSLTDFCQQPFANKDNESRSKHSLGGEAGKWKSQGMAADWLGGTTDANIAAERVTKGWPEGAARVMADLESLEVPAPIKVRRRVVRGPEGDEFDVHAAFRGDLEHAWTSRKRQRSIGPFAVRLITQINMLASFSGESLFWRGAAAVKAIDMLTEAGYTVEVIGVLASNHVEGNSKSHFAQSFPLKEAGGLLDVSQLAGVICNAGFHRLFGFRAYAAAVRGHHSIGSASSDSTGRVADAVLKFDDGIPTFRVPYGISNKQQAEEWLIDLTAKLQPEEQAA